MQFESFTVGDLTANPTTGHTRSEYERIRNTAPLAVKAEEVGLDVVAGGGHRPPFVPSSPTTRRGCIAACTALDPLDLGLTRHAFSKLFSYRTPPATAGRCRVSA